jgi:hypothetical protein
MFLIFFELILGYKLFFSDTQLHAGWELIINSFFSLIAAERERERESIGTKFFK